MKRLALIVFLTILWAEAFTGYDGNLTDRDGNSYRTVKIGSQTWMAENLNVKTEGSWCYEDKESNCQKYGRLYNWDAAKTACPAGWHLPSKGEFYALIDAVGGDDVAGKKLKFTSGWNENGNGWNKNGNGDDAFGFSALPAGLRDNDGDYYNEGINALFWSSTEYRSSDAYHMGMSYRHGEVGLYNYGKGYGYSVRCLKD